MQVQALTQKRTYTEMVQTVLAEFLSADSEYSKTSFLRNAFRIQNDFFDKFPLEAIAAADREEKLKTHQLQGRFNVEACFSHLTCEQRHDLEGYLLFFHFSNTADRSAYHTCLNNCFSKDAFRLVQFPLAYYKTAQEMANSFI